MTRGKIRRRFVRLAGVLTPLALGLTTALPAGASGGQVVVPRGSPVEIAVVLDHSGLNAAAGASARNAVQMAVEKHALIRGFRVQLNDYDGPCGNPPANAVAATEVVANSQNVAVIGHMCSSGDAVALPMYETAGLVTLSGSTTNPSLPTVGPNIFNAVIVPDPSSGAWYAQVQTLPSDIFWRMRYTKEFGSSPLLSADLYYDAASIILDEIAATATVDQGNLVIDRGALARAVRALSDSPAPGFKGVTCWIRLIQEPPEEGYRVNDPASLGQCAETGNGH